MSLPADIVGYHAELPGDARVTCERLAAAITDVLPEAVRAWLGEARIVQWDYANIVKRRGVSERLG